MKTKIAILIGMLCLITAGAQIAYINLTSLATNQVSSTAYITIPGVCTNAPYTATNPISIQIGDSISTAFGKVNTSFTYLSNRLNMTVGILTNSDGPLFLGAQNDNTNIYGGELTILGGRVQAENATASGANATAFGNDNFSTGQESFSTGVANTSSGLYSTTMGYANNATGNESIAMGDGANATNGNDFVFSDGQFSNPISQTNDSFNVWAAHGMFLNGINILSAIGATTANANSTIIPDTNFIFTANSTTPFVDGMYTLSGNTNLQYWVTTNLYFQQTSIDAIWQQFIVWTNGTPGTSNNIIVYLPNLTSSPLGSYGSRVFNMYSMVNSGSAIPYDGPYLPCGTNAIYTLYDQLPSGYAYYTVVWTQTQVGLNSPPTTFCHYTINSKGGSIIAGYGVYYPTNAFSVATVLSGMTNGGGWIGMSNGEMVSVTMTNNAAIWKNLNP